MKRPRIITRMRIASSHLIGFRKIRIPVHQIDKQTKPVQVMTVQI